MKYAKEIIDLMGPYPDREFKMAVIVNHIMNTAIPMPVSRNAVRKGAARVIQQMVESGAVIACESESGRGGYSTYRLVTGKKCDTNNSPIEPTCATMRPPQFRPQKVDDPRRAYISQKNGANSRGIDWEFTYSTWLETWGPYFHLRGPGKNGLCMARFGDVGPYSPGNVYLTTNMGNSIDRHTSEKAMLRKQATKERHESGFFYKNSGYRAISSARVQEKINEARDLGLI